MHDLTNHPSLWYYITAALSLLVVVIAIMMMITIAIVPWVAIRRAKTKMNKDTHSVLRSLYLKTVVAIALYLLLLALKALLFLALKTGAVSYMATYMAIDHATAADTIKTIITAGSAILMSAMVVVIANICYKIFSVLDIKKITQNKNITTYTAFVIKRIVASIMTFISFLVICHIWKIDTSKLILSLGIGGVAIAFAAQKTIENLFGGVSIIFDRPFRLGDFCKFGNQTGTVESIGIRSTRVKTLADTIITVPNSMLSDMSVENFSMRKSIRINMVIGLQYDSTLEQVKYTLIEIRRLFIAHPMVNDEDMYVRLSKFNDSSIDIELSSYVLTRDWYKFLEIKEEIMLKIMEIMASGGVSFAFPSRTLYLQRACPPDGEKVKHVENVIRKMEKDSGFSIKSTTEERERKLEDATQDAM